jgi:hypothetical protein
MDRFARRVKGFTVLSKHRLAAKEVRLWRTLKSECGDVSNVADVVGNVAWLYLSLFRLFYESGYMEPTMVHSSLSPLMVRLAFRMM